MKKKMSLFVVLAVFFSLMIGFGVGKSVADPDIYFVPDVVRQFKDLRGRPEALGFGIADSPNPTNTNHYQGIARSHGPGTPYFFVSRGSKGKGANLLVIEMGSRDKNGERLRSNRLFHGKHIDNTPPDSRDKVVGWIDFRAEEGWPAYDHAGGMQLVGDVLAVPLYGPQAIEWSSYCRNLIVFLDVSIPEEPTLLRYYCADNEYEFDAGAVALTKTGNGTYLLLVTGGENNELMILESNSKDFEDQNFDWNKRDFWTQSEDEQYLGNGWPSDSCNAGELQCNHPHQALNFVREEGEGSTKGDLYLIGTRNPGAGAPVPTYKDEDWFDLYRVEWCDDSRNSCQNEYVEDTYDQFTLRHELSKHVNSKPTPGGTDLLNLSASGGVYVSPTGELILYGGEHDNDGPKVNGRNSMKAGEYRHKFIVRPNSLTYLPTAIAKGPFEVPEGGEITLEGSGEPAATKAWIELYKRDLEGKYGSYKEYDNKSLIIDIDDWQKEDFKNFDDHEPDFNDVASAWRWLAPENCTLRVNDDDFEDDNFPGKYTKTLYGNGSVNEAKNLEDVTNDDGELHMGDELTSMQFFQNCYDYYDTPIDLWWDFDGDGYYETTGETPLFSAYGLDGPGEVTVGLKATHPLDGISGFSEAKIKITNVPPTADAGPDQVVECVYNSPVYLDATGSTDPGPDVLAFQWAFITVPGNSAPSFDDPMSATPSFVPNSLGIYETMVTVTDDDGASDSDQIMVTVEDTTPPEIIGIIATPAVLWPPNHKMMPVVLSVDAEDACDVSPNCSIVDVSSSEPLDGAGGGKASTDWIVTGDLSLQLRAERTGKGSGRTYTVEVECLDASGNSTVGTATISVPHSQKK